MVNRSRPPGHIIPTLYYADVGEAIEWLSRAFGFAEVFRYGSPASVEGAQMAAGGGFVMPPREVIVRPADVRETVWKMAPSPNRGDLRSVTSAEFARAVFEANEPIVRERVA